MSPQTYHPPACPVCNARNGEVTDSRATELCVRRRRRCKSCNHKWTTREIPDDDYQILQEARLFCVKLSGILLKAKKER